MKEIQELSKIKQALDADEVQELLRLRAQNARLLEVLTIISKNAPRTLKQNELADFGLWFVNAWDEDVKAIIARAAIAEGERKE